MLIVRSFLLFVLGVFTRNVGLARAADSGSSTDDSGFSDPTKYGERLLGWWDHGYGEPLNAILSNKSHPAILSDLSSWELPSFNHYFLAHYYSDECLGLSGPGKMVADLKDGKGSKPETGLKRWTFGDDYIGTCIQTFDGGMHFRYFKQNTTQGYEADGNGAIFLAVSAEKDLSKKHDIVLDGYNLGRDYLVGNLTQQTIRASSRYITPETNDVAIVNQEIGYYGMKTLDSITYKTTVRYVSRQSENTSEKINHAEKVTECGNNAVDGLIAVITVEIDESQRGSCILFPSQTYTSTFMIAALATVFALL